MGIVGAGVFGSYHAAKFADRDDVTLSAVFDTSFERATALALKHDAKPYQDYREFLLHIDAVVIAAPASDHAMLAETALQRGRHCFVEKPLALTVDAVDRLIARAKKKRLVLQVGHQERYVCEAVGLLARDIKPLRIECVRRVPFTGRCNDVSVAYDLMVHDLDTVRQLSGANVTNVHAEGDADEMSAELIMDNGTLAVIHAGRRSKTSERRMTVIYEDGVIDFDFIRRTLSNSTPAVLKADFTASQTPLAIRDPLAYGAKLFVEAIREAKHPVVCGQAGRVTVEWAQKIEEAAQLTHEEATVKRLRA